MGIAVSFFVTPHGFGHAARACALMQALRRLDPGVRLRVYGLSPEWLFRDSVGALDYRSLTTDVGLVQRGPLEEDIPATLERLGGFLPFGREHLQRLATELEDQDLVVCDIAPLGLAAARRAGVASVLVENFTWDWIYRAYLDTDPALARPVRYLRRLNRLADLHIQTEPVCVARNGAHRVPPVARAAHLDRARVRARLGVPDGLPLVLVSMGGMAARYPFLERLRDNRDWLALIPGSGDAIRREGGLLSLPVHSGHYHPDLVRASDALVCKLGYSTVAEALDQGTPVAYLPRERFPESPVLAAYVRRHLPALELEPGDWDSGDWIGRVPQLLAMGRGPGVVANGAERAARIMMSWLERVRGTGAAGGI